MTLHLTPETRRHGLPATDEQYQLLDVREVWEELAAALHHIQGLPHRYPNDMPDPVEPLAPMLTERDLRDGKANTNTKANLNPHTPISPPST
ncbi:hypothetical protein E6R18_25150 [Streptomyces sp. A1277]|uniref:hypothetical protein n=1 Tax=Streptomyces sp. A1277 TaxID=2563103 RepID=UPI0010A2315F|nr:hypothetical protein [Streptomyces sp. A1277]THA29201.1 hypothetical protein E6R18_25150 [Streptomyces sp. A1277]